MSFFRKPTSAKKVTCEDVVDAYSIKLQNGRMFEDEDTLPFDAELIKSALVYTAIKTNSAAAVDAAKTGFLLLNDYIGKSKKIVITGDNENVLLGTLKGEQDALLAEFDARFTLAKRLQNA